jgi:hypothetical protein
MNEPTPHRDARHRHRDVTPRPARSRSNEYARGAWHIAKFLRAAERGNYRVLIAMLDGGFPINYQDPRSGRAALHAVAASRARTALRVLLKTDECDFLVRDGQGRLPSEMAYLYGKDPVIARFLARKERQQAQKQGIALARRSSL